MSTPEADHTGPTGEAATAAIATRVTSQADPSQDACAACNGRHRKHACGKGVRISRPRSKDNAVKVAAVVSNTCAAEDVDEEEEEEAEMEEEAVDVAAVKRTLKEAAEIFGDATEVSSHEPGASIHVTRRGESVPVKQEVAVQEVSEVARWLDENSLGHLLEILNDNGIDFEALKLMEKSDMMEMCGLKMGDRLKLWKAKQSDPMLSN